MYISMTKCKTIIRCAFINIQRYIPLYSSTYCAAKMYIGKTFHFYNHLFIPPILTSSSNLNHFPNKFSNFIFYIIIYVCNVYNINSWTPINIIQLYFSLNLINALILIISWLWIELCQLFSEFLCQFFTGCGQHTPWHNIEFPACGINNHAACFKH